MRIHEHLAKVKRSKHSNPAGRLRDSSTETTSRHFRSLPRIALIDHYLLPNYKSSSGQFKTFKLFVYFFNGDCEINVCHRCDLPRWKVGCSFTKIFGVRSLNDFSFVFWENLLRDLFYFWESPLESLQSDQTWQKNFTIWSTLSGNRDSLLEGGWKIALRWFAILKLRSYENDLKWFKLKNLLKSLVREFRICLVNPWSAATNSSHDVGHEEIRKLIKFHRILTGNVRNLFRSC